MTALFALTVAVATAAAPGPSGGGAAPPTGAQEESGPSARQEYDEKYIWAEDFPVVYGNRHYVTTTTGTFFFQGKYRKPLAGADLYDAIGRPDLATIYRDRLTRRSILMGAGLALLIGGWVYIAAGASTGNPDVNLPPDQFAREAQAAQDAARNAATVGAVISTGGLALIAIGASLRVDPLDASEARRLVDEYDRGLQEKLGPGAAGPGESPPRAGRPRLSLGVAPGQGGAMASLAIAF